MNLAIMMSHIGGMGGVETITEMLLNTRLVEDYQLILIFPDLTSKNKKWISELNEKYNGRAHFIIIDKSLSNSRFGRLYFIIKTLVCNKIDYLIDLSVKTTKLEYIVRKFTNQSYKIICWLHNMYYEESIKKYGNYPDAYLAISTGLREKIIEWGDVNPDDVYLIYNPISRNSVIPLSNDRKTKFVYMGRIDETQKNLYEMIDAFSKVNSQLYELHFYGDGPDKCRVEQYADEKHINGYFHGWKNNPWESVYKDGINYLILTSNYEGFGMVLAEAISRGIPVISSNCLAGPSDIVQPQSNGYLYELHNKQSLVDIVNQAIVNRDNWNQDDVQKSINFLYMNEYLPRFENALEEIMMKER